jgi:hypothetical protein
MAPADPSPVLFRTLWSHRLLSRPLGLALAREKGWLLAWDQSDWLYLVNPRGERQGQWHAPAPLASAAAADDGSAFVALARDGRIWWLAPDCSIRWEQALDDAAVSAALDPFGQYLAIGDARGRLHFLDRLGRLVSRLESPRPLLHLAFVPAAPLLVGSADYGLVACLDLAGHWLWRDGLVAHVGSLAVSEDGTLVLLACFTEGLRGYAVNGRHPGRLALDEPCCRAALSFDGRQVFAADLNHRLLLVEPTGRLRAAHRLDLEPVALALSPLGDRGYVARADGTILCLSTAV